jgi:flagellar motor switch/type III secretory pathway protein FliN
VLVNGIPVAHGEVVIVDDSTAIRITELLAPPSSEIFE